MWPETFESMLPFMMLMMMAALLRMAYETSHADERGVQNLPQVRPLVETDLTPWQKKASEKAVKRYAESQPKKWRHWNEAMFERT